MRILFALVFLLTLKHAVAQAPISIHLTEKEGLPDKEFYSLIEDKDGFIWLAADKGLYRYDGFEFKSYTHPKQIGLSVFSLSVDYENVVWYTNLSNQVFYIKENKVYLFKDLKSFFKGTVPQIKIYKDFLFLTVSNECIIFNKHTGDLLFKKEYNTPVFYSQFFKQGEGFFTFSGYGELTKIDSDFKEINFGKKITFPKERVRRAYVSKIKNSFLVVSNCNDQITRYHVIRENIEGNFKFSTSEIFTEFTIHQLKVIDEQLYFITNKGVFVYELQNNQLVLKNKMLEGISVSDILKDSKENLWVTTLNQGVHVFPNMAIKSNFKAPSFNGFRKMFLGKEDELFLIGRQKEIYHFKSKTNNVSSILLKDVSEIKYLFYEKARDLYYIQHKESFNSYKLKGEKFSLKKEHRSESIKDHFFVSKDTLLLATGTGSQMIFFENISSLYFNSKVEVNRSYSCYGDSKTKQYYFGTVNGFFVFDANFSKKEILHNKSSIYIRDITSSKDGAIWALSLKNGLYKIKNNKVEANYTIANGLLSNINSFIKYDKLTNSVWLAGDAGIQQLDISSNTFFNLTKNNGIPTYEFVGIEVIDNQLYIATTNQLFSINTQLNSKKKSVKKPIPYFTTVIIDDEQKEIKSKYILPSNNNKIEIGYNTNGFLSRENVSYEYRLLESQKNNIDWQQETSKSNKIIYNKLPQGAYVFQLKALKGNTYSEVKELKFLVKGVFYEQWWFFLLLTILIGTLLWWYFNRKNTALKEKQKLIIDKQNKELENVFLKLESLRSQMNPHFIFNALNSIQDYILNNEKKLARTYLVKFSRLIRLYLEHSQKNTISLHDELEALNFYLELEKDRFEDSFNYKIEVDNSINKEFIEIPTFLIQPYVENAIKHGLLHKKEKRELFIHFSIDKNKEVLICEIDDNGVGREASNKINNRKAFKPVSFSSEANAKRINLLNKTRKKPIQLEIKDKYNEDLQATGTLVKIKIPVK